MANIVFYRNARARDLLDAFLISAITSLLLVRFYLHITGYPQIGGGSLHIAHMLYGGIFMMIAIVITLSFLGVRARQTAAIIGGIGFGVFIDELGKFITKDNDYFFHPTIGLIYAVFVVLYLSFNFMTRTQKLTSREYQINALAELEEVVARDMDRTEKARLEMYLDASDPDSQLTKQLKKLLSGAEISAIHRPGRLGKFLNNVDRQYSRFWQMRSSHALIGALFVAEILILVAGSVYTIYTNIDDLPAFFGAAPTYGQELILGQVGSSIVAAGFVIYGLTKLNTSHLAAFEQFRRAALINLYLTQFFVFVRLQFEALPGFVLNLMILLLIVFVIRQEIRLGRRYVHHRR